MTRVNPQISYTIPDGRLTIDGLQLFRGFEQRIATLEAAPGGGSYAPLVHTHTISDVTGLAAALVPVGGGTGQVLAKASATNYDLTWATPSAGLTYGAVLSAVSLRV